MGTKTLGYLHYVHYLFLYKAKNNFKTLIHILENMGGNPKFKNDVDVGLTVNAKQNGLGRTMKCSKELQAVIGKENISRLDCMTEIWAYIKKNKLQNPQQRQFVVPDAKLIPVLGKKNVSIHKLAKLLEPHFKPMSPREMIEMWKNETKEKS